MPDQKKVPFRGTPVYMDGRWWIVPPISVRQMQDYEAELNALAPDARGANVDLTLSLIQKALSRNYPSITAEWLKDALDGASIKASVEAISALSGLTEVAPGE